MENKNSDNISRMHLNARNHSDNTFNSDIKFVVEKYVYDDIPQQIYCNSIHTAIYEAYKLFLNDELHSIGIYDKDNNYNGTDALNYFDNNIHNEAQQNKIEELEKEIQVYKDFLKKYNCEKTFQDHKDNIKE